jgi:hypothetical protein
VILKRIALVEGPSGRAWDRQGRPGAAANANFTAEDAELAEKGSGGGNRSGRERAELDGELNMGDSSRISECCQEDNRKM